ncbi:MAG: undecaprenyl-diphosphatase UppP [Anaerolineales bacterium]|nr:undecaprenyl-diphosphatase UppP [Anaerolineales bacterium]
MTFFHAFLLGIIQGLTEFIPVSSTAHLLIGQTLFGLPADDGMFSFLVLIQIGTIVSLLIYFWKDLLSILADTLKNLGGLRDFKTLPPNAKMGWYILIATIPALLAGYLLKDAVEALFRLPLLQAAIRLFAAAILLTLAEWLTRKDRQLDSMTWLDALAVGLFQIISVFPGASRSGSTISGGMFRGFDRPSAARFAFLMSVPVMLAAGAYEMLDVVRMPGLTEFLPALAVGFITAAVVGWFAVRWLLSYLARRSLYIFSIYCAIVGMLVFIASRI